MTTRNVAPKSRKSTEALPTPEEYSEFVGQIDLANLWLAEARIINHHGPQTPHGAALAITAPAPKWANVVDGFDVQFPYTVKFQEGTSVRAEMEVRFGLHFTSARPMTSAIFEVFKSVNLPVNTWPFLREFVSTALGRMGWQPFTLPALKVSVPDGEDVAEEKPAPRNRKQSRRG
jgi:hypothetical protein